jgi:hypothetical protein
MGEGIEGESYKKDNVTGVKGCNICKELLSLLGYV